MASILDEFLILFKPTVKGNGLTRLNRDLKQTHSNLFSMKNLFGAFIGYDIYSGIKAIGSSLIDASREMGAMRSRFFAITQDEKKANEELEWAFKLAQKTAMPMKALADSYSIFFAATQKGLGTSGAREVFQDWTEVSRVLHLSEYQFERVTYALREMASKGAIYSQDLRMQIGTHVPNAIGLAQKAAEDLGITGTDWFEKLQEQAKGNQKLINQFITLFSKHAKDMYADPEALAKALKQPDAQIIRLQQQWDKLRYAMVESGFQEDLLKVLGKLNDTLDKITAQSAEFYKMLKMIGKVIAIVFAWKYFRVAITAFRRMSVMLKALTKGKFLPKGLSKFVKGNGLKALLKLLQGQLLRRFLTLGLRGVLAFIPVVGQIIFVLWTAWDIIQLIWSGLKIFFPEQTRAVKFWVLTTWNNIQALGKKILNWLVMFITLPYRLGAKLGQWLADQLINVGKKISNWWNNLPFNRGKSKVEFPGVTPNKDSWDYVYNQSQITPLTTQLANRQTPVGNNITINSPISIDASGLTPEEAAEMIAMAQAENNTHILNTLNKNVANSKF